MNDPSIRFRHRRALGTVFAIALTISAVLTVFSSTQVLHGRHFSRRAEQNHLRPFPIPAARGDIVDREGRIVAHSVPGYAIWLLPAESVAARRTLEDAAALLGLSAAEIDSLLDARLTRPDAPLILRRDAGHAMVAALEEQRDAFPNIFIQEYPEREYPAGAAVAHLVGYLGEISREELELPEARAALWKGLAGVTDWELGGTARLSALERWSAGRSTGRQVRHRIPMAQIMAVRGLCRPSGEAAGDRDRRARRAWAQWK